jgi:lactoylglutathione lyase
VAIKVTGLEHVAVQVKDLERSLSFYQGVLGLAVRERGEFPDRGLRKVLLSAGGSEVELLEYSGVPVPEKDGPVVHIAFGVTDIAEALVGLKAAQANLEDEEPRELAGGVKIAFLRGPDGERIELYQKA